MGLLINAFLFNISLGIILMLMSTGSEIPNSCNAYTTFYDVGTTSIQPAGDFNSTFPTTVESGSLSSGASTAFSFIDPIRMILKLINFIMAVTFAPLACGPALGLPIWLQILLSIPTLLMMMGILFFFRGSSGGN